MTADFTWTHSAGEYQDIYCQLTGLAAPSAQPEEPVPALSPKPETSALKGREKAPALEAGGKTAQSKAKSSAVVKADPLSAPKKRATPRKKKEAPPSEGK